MFTVWFFATMLGISAGAVSRRASSADREAWRACVRQVSLRPTGKLAADREAGRHGSGGLRAHNRSFKASVAQGFNASGVQYSGAAA